MLNSVIAVVGANSSSNSANLDAMIEIMKRRGVLSKSFVSEGVALGNSVSDSSGKYVISFDGALPATISPMKKMLESYKVHGEKCLDLFDGSFAFCLWDSIKEKLFVAKDRYGRRPLYYSFINSKEVVFASQIDALWLLKEREPNLDMMSNFLVTGWHNHDGATFYKDVREFLPGHFSYLSTKNLNFTQEPYSHYPKLSSNIHSKRSNVVAEFSNLLLDTIQKATPSEGDYATSVSGGLDSTIIASILCRKDETERHKLYSAICEGASYDEEEAPYIAEFERFIQKEINYIKMPLPPSWNELQKFINSIFSPTDGLNAFLFWSIARKMKKDNINSVFLGTAADAFLFGLKEKQIEYLRLLWKHRKISVFAKELLGLFVKGDYSSGVINRVILELKDMVRSSRENYDSKQLLDANFLENHFRHARLWLDRTSIHLMDNMEIADRMFASNGVEPIHPFLEKPIVEYLASLPMDMKIKRGIRKYILRMSAKGLVPEAIRKSKRKFPSSVPQARWLVEWEKEINDLINSEGFKARGFYNTERIKENYNRLLDGKMNRTEKYAFTSQLWRIINVEIWFKQNFD